MDKTGYFLWITIFINMFFGGYLYAQAEDKPVPWTTPIGLCWEYKSGSMTNLKLASDNASNTIFLPNSGGTILAITADTGTLLWKSELSGIYYSELKSFENKLFIITKNTFEQENISKLHEINMRTGITNTPAEFKDLDFVYLTHYQNSIQLTDTNGRIIDIDLQTSERADRQIEARIQTSPLAQGDKMFIGTDNKTILIFSNLIEKVEKQFNLNSKASYLTASPEYLYIGDTEGNIYAFRINSLEIEWHIKTGGKIKNIEIWKDSLIISSDDNFIYSVSAKNGNKVWKKRMDGRILGNTFIEHGYAALTAFNSNTVEIVNLEKGKSVNRIKFSENEQIISSPIFIKQFLVIPFQNGLKAYSPLCR